MAAGIRVLRAERRAERIDLRHRHAIGFDVELSGDGEERLAPEEVLAEVNFALGRARQIHEVERRDAEQLAGAFRIRSGDDRRIDPEKAMLVEETMDRLCDGVAHACDGADHVGARAQMRDLPEELERVRLWLK